ncbi:MAG: hypothetical protein ACKV2T_03750 [Kofleriaceae bacterium]
MITVNGIPDAVVDVVYRGASSSTVGAVIAGDASAFAAASLAELARSSGVLTSVEATARSDPVSAGTASGTSINAGAELSAARDVVLYFTRSNTTRIKPPRRHRT